jgi:predicted GIY-YIG superfamily endonuclease
MYSVYKVIQNEKIIYVGSTNNLNRRKNEHRNRCFKETDKNYNCHLYQHLRTITTRENFKNDVIFEVIQETDKKQSKIVENEYIQKYKPDETLLNEINSFTSLEERRQNKREWNQRNKDKIDKKAKSEYNREYSLKNKDKLNEKRRERYNPEKQKEYNENNKDAKKEAYKKWYEANKEELNRKKRERRAYLKSLKKSS